MNEIRSARWKWPTPYEWGSLSFSLAALVVSVGSYVVSKQTADAQKENIEIVCDTSGDIEQIFWETNSLKNPPPENEKKYLMRAAWTAHIYNNSTEPVTIRYFDVSRYIDARTQEQFTEVARNKHGADHLVGDRDVSIEPRKATTIRFTADVPISPKAAVEPGIKRAKNVDDADQLLLHRGVGFEYFRKQANRGG